MPALRSVSSGVIVGSASEREGFRDHVTGPCKPCVGHGHSLLSHRVKDFEPRDLRSHDEDAQRTDVLLVQPSQALRVSVTTLAMVAKLVAWSDARPGALWSVRALLPPREGWGGGPRPGERFKRPSGVFIWTYGADVDPPTWKRTRSASGAKGSP